ncbi:antitoxin VapB family protein [Candidatus Woesearchaeota archaeon]|nr:antitoxin VapB family protein [Candidatus Woesearchaeota archaeon]
MGMTKVISLSDEAYDEMKSAKHKGESFSDVVIRVVGKSRRSLADFCGGWPGSDDEAKSIAKTLEADRKRFKARQADF